LDGEFLWSDAGNVNKACSEGSEMW